ncbi:MAG: hypothetical protein HND43_05560 [Armatimonadetes bacterium]|nr:hypothetical protein [Armatimonadota bacterium]NOG38848.1 hypothetical protein [Armatimonadota bacterium]GIK31265.1 MAG: hypothetical protein BroJett009_02570 [Armatimonadota bacterium]
MRVQDVECKLAQGQIQRYLAGESLSATATRQLRDHIHECSRCSELVATRKRALESMVAVGSAVVQMEEPEAAPEPETTPQADPAQTLLDFVRQKATAFAPQQPQPDDRPKSRIHWKPLAWSTALALVLIVMSQISRDPTRLFGDRASEVSLSTPSKAAEVDTAATSQGSSTDGPQEPSPEPAPSSALTAANPSPEEAKAASPNVSETPNSSEPAAGASSEATRQPQPRPKPKTAAAQPATGPAASSIRVYDASGNPISR